MSYFEEDDLNIWTENHFSIPASLKEKLLYKEDILSKLDDSQNPIDLSIQKWEMVLEIVEFVSEKGSPYFYYKDIYQYIGFETCALCLVSTRKFIEKFGSVKYAEDKCRVCPLAKIDRCTEESSTFEIIADILFKGFSYLESRSETLGEEDLQNNHLLLIPYIKKMISNLTFLKESK